MGVEVKNRLNIPLTREQTYPAAFLLVVLLVWELGVEVLNIPEYFLPAPIVIIESIIVDFGQYFGATTTTFYYAIVGFAIGSLVGISLGVVLYLSEVLERSSKPMLLILFVVPKIVIAPILILWWGASSTYFIAVPVLLVFYTVMEATLEGLKTVPGELDNLGRLSGASLPFRIWNIHLPYSLPYIFGGFKVGIKQAVVGVIVAEFIAPEQGLGQLMIVGVQFGQPLVAWGAILLTVSLGILLYAIIDLVDKRVVFWTKEGYDEF